MAGTFVMVVDDEEVILEAMTAVLEKAGYQVTTASDAWQAIIQVQGVKVWLIITDINMPGIGDGVDVYKRLREASKTLPIIFMTNLRLDAARAKIPPDPLVRLLSKPINLVELRQAIKELTGVDRPL